MLAHVDRDFPFEVQGGRLALKVFGIRPDSDCITHGFTTAESPLSDGAQRVVLAYKSDCRSWSSSGYDIYLYRVRLRNLSGQSVRFNLRNFAVLTSRGQSFGPVDVRSHATSPPEFLPETEFIVPGASLNGWLTFDGRPDFVPSQLSYVDGDQALSISFGGQHVQL